MVMISSKINPSRIDLTLPELQQLLNKIEPGDVDVQWASGTTTTAPPPPPPPSDQMKVYRNICGECYSLIYHGCRVIIDQVLLLKLLYIKQQLESFINFDDRDRTTVAAQ